MKQIFALLGTTAATLLIATSANAAGCVSGAVVGGVAGHVAHHHAVLGAAAGCVVGHEMNKHEKKKAAEANGQ
ncbi:hypothetical protein [Acidisoma silvae]|uniref:Glycine zipper 2TM domain-containing protein n=1 Tax=Acidisoma silvae TaxID=2802396 RepID=A0A964E064_9PROT|nr:hypothetical protein [Acidisoma silvae]MCB8876839.1 hypothetical protein [Acidisoma silvae]